MYDTGGVQYRTLATTSYAGFCDLGFRRPTVTTSAYREIVFMD